MTVCALELPVGHGGRQHLTSSGQRLTTKSILSSSSMLILLSLFTTSSVVVASHDVAEGPSGPWSTTIASTRPLTQRVTGPTNASTTTTPPVRVELPPADPPSPGTSTATTTAARDASGRRHGDRSRPDTEVDRSTDVQRLSNRTTRPRDDDGLRRRRFHLMSAAQVNTMLSGWYKCGITKAQNAIYWTPLSAPGVGRGGFWRSWDPDN